MLQALRGETVVDRVISTRPRGGSVRYLRCNGARLYDRRGNSVGAVVFAADVTAPVVQRKELASLREQLPEKATRHLEPIGRAVERLDGVLHTIRELADRSAKPTA